MDEIEKAIARVMDMLSPDEVQAVEEGFAEQSVRANAAREKQLKEAAEKEAERLAVAQKVADQRTLMRKIRNDPEIVFKIPPDEVLKLLQACYFGEYADSPDGDYFDIYAMASSYLENTTEKPLIATAEIACVMLDLDFGEVDEYSIANALLQAIFDAGRGAALEDK